MAVFALVLFVVLFVVTFVLRAAMQRHATGDTGLRTGALRAEVGSVEWWAGWAFVLALVTAVAAPIAELAGLEPLTNSPWVRGVGVALAAGGIGLTFRSQIDMGTAWRIGVDADEATGLVTGGAFAVVRNPVFSGLLVAGAGLALMVPNAIALAGFLLLWLAIELQVRYVEEPHLRRLHGEEYAAYAAEVGRFVPGLGRS